MSVIQHKCNTVKVNKLSEKKQNQRIYSSFVNRHNICLLFFFYLCDIVVNKTLGLVISQNIPTNFWIGYTTNHLSKFSQIQK